MQKAGNAFPAFLRQPRIGGATRIRTGDGGFADLCLTAWRWRLRRSQTPHLVLTRRTVVNPPGCGRAASRACGPPEHDVVAAFVRRRIAHFHPGGASARRASHLVGPPACEMGHGPGHGPGDLQVHGDLGSLGAHGARPHPGVGLGPGGEVPHPPAEFGGQAADAGKAPVHPRRTPRQPPAMARPLPPERAEPKCTGLPADVHALDCTPVSAGRNRPLHAPQLPDSSKDELHGQRCQDESHETGGHPEAGAPEPPEQRNREPERQVHQGQVASDGSP